MNKIHRKILGFHPIIKFDNSIRRIRKMDWYGNANDLIDFNSLPDHYEEEIFDWNSKTRTINIYKDTSDTNKDEKGNNRELGSFLHKPKKCYIDKFDINNNRIERKVINSGQIESVTLFDYDKNNNLIKNSYSRLGYIQHYHIYNYDSQSNLIEIIFYKDLNYGSGEYKPETKSIFSYIENDKLSFNRLDFKYQENEFVERSSNKSAVNVLKGNAFEVETTMLHLRTGSKGRTIRKFDENLNQVANYSFIDDKYHPHSVNYMFEYDEFENWILKSRVRMDNTITLKSKQDIEYQ